MTTNMNIRIPKHLKEKIEGLGYEQEKSISDITRSIIEDFFNTSCNLNDTRSPTITDKIDFLQTLGFTELIFWIYKKKLDPEINESEEFYYQLINEIEKLKKHPLFTVEIINEFNKISIELKEYLRGVSSSTSEFSFSSIDNYYGFNYELFEYFFHGIRYDENDNRILNIQ